MIAHARSAEDGGKYGVNGDQTGNEVSITPIYDRGWNFAFRCKDEPTRCQIADRAIVICENDYIGYSQDNRLSLWEYYQRCGSFSGIDMACNCDCSSLVAAVLKSLGFDVPASMYTGIEYDSIMATGAFMAYQVHGENYDFLKKGDILLASGHTAIVVESDNVNPNNRYGVEWEAVTDVYIRERPDKESRVLGVVPCGGTFNFSDIVINGFGLGLYLSVTNMITGYTSIKYYEDRK